MDMSPLLFTNKTLHAFDFAIGNIGHSGHAEHEGHAGQ